MYTPINIAPLIHVYPGKHGANFEEGKAGGLRGDGK